MNAIKLSRKQVTVLRTAPLAGAPNKIRIALGLTGANQSDLAAASAIKAPNLSDIVNGKSPRITLDTARRISRALGVCVEDIFPPLCVLSEPRRTKRAA